MPAAMKFVFLRPSLEEAAAFAAWHEVHVPIVVSMGQAVLYLIANISFELNNLCVHVYKYRPSTRPIPPPPRLCEPCCACDVCMQVLRIALGVERVLTSTSLILFLFIFVSCSGSRPLGLVQQSLSLNGATVHPLD
jgi:hypothetical protein